MVIMSETTVDTYLQHATADMHRNNRREINYPCRKCRLNSLLNPYSGQLKEHLLMRGFMDGHTQWMSVEDEEEVDHGAAGNEEGQ